MQIASPAFFLVFAALLSVPQPVPIQTSISWYRLVRPYMHTIQPTSSASVFVSISLKSPLQPWRPYTYICINIYTRIILLYVNMYIQMNTMLTIIVDPPTGRLSCAHTVNCMYLIFIPFWPSPLPSWLHFPLQRPLSSVAVSVLSPPSSYSNFSLSL